MKRLQYADLVLGQGLAGCIKERAQQLAEQGTEVEVDWVSGHMDVEWNEKADEVVKKAV